MNKPIQPRAVDGWSVQSLGDARARARFAAAVRARFQGDELNHDVEWLEAACDTARGDMILTYASLANGVLAGVLPLRVATSDLVYTVRRRVLFKKRVREYRMFGGPLAAGADPASAVGAAMTTLARELPADAVVQVSAVPCGGAFHAMLTDPDSPVRRLFNVLPWGPENLHCKIDWTGTVEGYLASLGADSRRNLKRYSKKLFSAVELSPRIDRFRSVEEVARFLDDGVAVSDKTYQKRDLGLGLVRGGALERRMRFAAERGAFLGHILYLEGKPAAFHYGFINGQTFFVLAMGYDPAVAKHQAGAVLWHGVLEDVEKLKLPVTTIDCLSGVTDFKLRTTNRKAPIRNYYLFKKSPSGAALYLALKAIDAVVERAKALSGTGAGTQAAGQAS